MNSVIKVPKPPLRREHKFSVRLTSVEYQALKLLARQMDVSLSHLVRHFLMQAVEYHSTEKVGGDAN